MTKYGPFRMLQVMHLLHRERKQKEFNVGSHGGRRDSGNKRKKICLLNAYVLCRTPFTSTGM